MKYCQSFFCLLSLCQKKEMLVTGFFGYHTCKIYHLSFFRQGFDFQLMDMAEIKASPKKSNH